MTQYQKALDDAKRVYESLAGLEKLLETAAAVCVKSLAGGGTLFACGNGGSACEAQHFVGELVGRYKSNRRALAAVALNADGATMTCIGNDFCYEDVFARQLEALGRPGDVLIVFTTSGKSSNVLRALETARAAGIQTIALLGRGGGAAVSLADLALVVSHEDTARIQEGHQFLLHSLMDQIEAGLGIGS